MIPQPHVCECFGGSCWKNLCPNRPNKKKKASKERSKQVKSKKKEPEVLTWHPQEENE